MSSDKTYVQAEVFVLSAGSTLGSDHWSLLANHKSEIRAVNDEGDHEPGELWDKLALTIVRNAADYNCQEHRAVEVFFYLNDDLLTSVYNVSDLKRFVADARRHAWGGKVYVAWNRTRGTDFSRVVGETPDLLEVWFQLLLEEGVAGVLEIKSDSATSSPEGLDPRRLLRKFEAKFSTRREELKPFVTNEGWKLIHRRELKPLEIMVDRFMKRGLLPTESCNSLMFFDRKLASSGSLMGHFLNGPHRAALGRHFVATTVADPELVSECGKVEPPLKVIAFDGVFEVLYSLLQLNHARTENKN